MSPKSLHIAAAIITDARRRMLLVRKSGTRFFMQPGGKLDAGESAETALVREIGEELGLEIAANRCRAVGRFQAVAANEPNCVVIADLFALEVTAHEKPCAAAEIAELRWVTAPQATALPLAPLTRDHVLPLLDDRCV